MDKKLSLARRLAVRVQRGTLYYKITDSITIIITGNRGVAMLSPSHVNSLCASGRPAAGLKKEITRLADSTLAIDRRICLAVAGIVSNHCWIVTSLSEWLAIKSIV